MNNCKCSSEACSEVKRLRDLLSLALDKLQVSLEEKQQLRQQLIKLRK